MKTPQDEAESPESFKGKMLIFSCCFAILQVHLQTCAGVFMVSFESWRMFSTNNSPHPVDSEMLDSITFNLAFIINKMCL